MNKNLRHRAFKDDEETNDAVLMIWSGFHQPFFERVLHPSVSVSKSVWLGTVIMFNNK